MDPQNRIHTPLTWRLVQAEHDLAQDQHLRGAALAVDDDRDVAVGEAVDQVELADEGRQLLVFSGGIAGRCGRCAGQRDDQRQGQGRHTAAGGRQVAKGCHHAVPQSSGWRDAAA